MTAERQPVHREDDGELLGFLLAGGGDLWIPATDFGATLDAPRPRDVAEATVRERGMSSLAGRWQYVDAHGETHTAYIIEASPTSVTIMLGDLVADPTTRQTLPAPVGDALRPWQ